MGGLGKAGAIRFGRHRNPLDAPEQEPTRNKPAEQATLLQALHDPGLTPTRYWLVGQTVFGMVVHPKPLVVPPHEPVRRWPPGQLMLRHVAHDPGLEPTRYWLVAQPVFGMVVHLNPLVVPLHEPERCWPPGQPRLLHVAHLNPFDVPLHEPDLVVLRWVAAHAAMANEPTPTATKVQWAAFQTRAQPGVPGQESANTSDKGRPWGWTGWGKGGHITGTGCCRS